MARSNNRSSSQGTSNGKLKGGSKRKKHRHQECPWQVQIHEQGNVQKHVHKQLHVPKTYQNTTKQNDSKMSPNRQSKIKKFCTHIEMEHVAYGQDLKLNAM